jgi:hypothetical protein
MLHDAKWSKTMQTNTPDLVDESVARAIIGGAASPISRATLWRHVKAGRFPKPLKIGARNRWKRDELVAVVEKAAAAR